MQEPAPAFTQGRTVRALQERDGYTHKRQHQERRIGAEHCQHVGRAVRLSAFAPGHAWARLASHRPNWTP